MKYFLIETNEKNRIPYNINKNHAIDIRMLNRSDFDGLPMWNIVEMDFPREGFFPDMICSPFLLLSEVYLKTVMMYQRMCFLKELSYGIKRAVLMSHICW